MSVEQTDTVDAIGTDKATGKIFLTIADHLPWNGEHLLTLQQKLNAYLRFLESGEVYQSYPNATGRDFVIRIFLQHRPTDEAINFLQRAQETIESAGFGLVFGPLHSGYADDDG
jgi:hypothetical protein